MPDSATYFCTIPIPISPPSWWGLSSTALDSFRRTATYTLSALGDSFFGGSLLVLWSLSMTILLVCGWHAAACIWFALWFVALQIFKAVTFWMGVCKGLSFLQKLRQMDLMGWGHRIKLVNALFVLLIWWLIFPFPLQPGWFAAGSGLLGLAAWLVQKGFIRREGIVAAGILAWIVLQPVL